MKQRRAKDGFAAWEEFKEEQRRQMNRRDAEAAERNSELSEQRSFDLMNRSFEFAQRVELGQKRGAAILGNRTETLLKAAATHDKRTSDYARLTSSELVRYSSLSAHFLTVLRTFAESLAWV